MKTIDLDALSASVGRALVERRWLLATAESCTGGGVAECVTRTAGSSAWFDRAFITYTNDAKRQMLGVSPVTLDDVGAVSEAVAREMATGALAHSDAHITVAITGIAGPGGGSPAKPVGLVCFAWAVRAGACDSTQRIFAGDRSAVRMASIEFALQGVIERAMAHQGGT